MHPFKENLFQFATSGPIDELCHKCGAEMTKAMQSSETYHLSDLADVMNTLSNIIRYSNVMIESNIPQPCMELSKETHFSIKNAALLSLCEYTGMSQKEVMYIANNADKVSQALWSKYYSDPDTVTEEQLDAFYNESGQYNLFFSRYLDSMNISLGSALRGFIAYKATQIGGKCFDFGGGIGNLTSAMSKLGHQDAHLVETDTKQLNFVKWKDEQCGINNVGYIGTNEIADFFENQKESYRFGIAMELLEHVYDPPGLLASLSELIEPGGYLFLTSSFHVYPHTGHLKSNVQYTDKEDELLKPYGFERAQFDDAPVPFLFCWKLFKKTSNPA